MKKYYIDMRGFEKTILRRESLIVKNRNAGIAFHFSSHHSILQKIQHHDVIYFQIKELPHPTSYGKFSRIYHISVSQICIAKLMKHSHYN